MSELKKPKLSDTAQKHLDDAEKQFDAFDKNIKEMTLDRMNMAPKEEVEPQTKLSQKEIEKSKDIYLKPTRTVSDRQKFNERFRDKWNFDKEYVQFIAENKEIIGETIEMWTHPYGGVNAEFWQVPVNKPVWGPRHLAEQIKRKYYHRLTMQQTPVSSDGMGQYYGSMAVDTTIPRLDARPAQTGRKSVFMGSASF